jgi:hypothetical protein
VNTEFNWWLLIVGLVIGAGVVWLVLADARRREVDVAERERESEARWIGEAMRDAGRKVSDADALDVLRLHAAYLAAPPPDELEPLDDEVDRGPEDRSTARRPDLVGGAGGGPMAPAHGEARPPMAHPARATEPVDAER